MNGYEAKIVNASKELSAKERLQIKDTTDCVKLDKATENGDVVIDVDFYAVIAVHNENSEDKDYEQYVIVDKNGTRYVTGSESFFTSFVDICDEMSDESTEEWSIKAYRKASTKREGKYFITCSIM